MHTGLCDLEGVKSLARSSFHSFKTRLRAELSQLAVKLQEQRRKNMMSMLANWSLTIALQIGGLHLQGPGCSPGSRSTPGVKPAKRVPLCPSQLAPSRGFHLQHSGSSDRRDKRTQARVPPTLKKSEITASCKVHPPPRGVMSGKSLCFTQEKQSQGHQWVTKSGFGIVNLMPIKLNSQPSWLLSLIFIFFLIKRFLTRFCNYSF